MNTRKRYTQNAFLLLLGAALSGCSEQPAGEPSGNAEIRLFTEVSTPTRGGIDGFAGETVAFASGSASGAYGEVWEAAVHGNEASFVRPRYYPDNNSRVYLRGYYPAVPLSATGVAFLINGQQDLLLSDEQNGCLTDMFWQETKRFTFSHLLTQLNIRLRVTESYPEGATLKRLRLGGSRTKALLNLDKGSLAFSGDASLLPVWSAPVGGSASGSGGSPLGTLYPDTLIGPVMAEPGVALTLEVTIGIPGEADRLYPTLAIRFGEADSLPLPGTAYTVSVTLGSAGSPPEGVTLSATVANWLKGNEGTGTIEKKNKRF